MNRIDIALKAQKKAFVGFITSGDPSVEETYRYALALFDAGVDILELGVPFSDPVAEGPVIQAASERALKAGFRIDSLFDMTKRLREKTDKPILYMLYMNCIYAYGKEKFFDNCRKAGVDGVIVPDLPFEEQWELEPLVNKYNIYSIYLLAPTSEGRIKRIAENAKGFIYAVSSRGVTGMRSDFTTDFAAFSNEIKKHAHVPSCVGFGISNPEQAKKLSRYFDGVIMGSAFVKIIEQYGENAEERLRELASSIRIAIDSV